MITTPRKLSTVTLKFHDGREIERQIKPFGDDSEPSVPSVIFHQEGAVAAIFVKVGDRDYLEATVGRTL